MRVAFRARLDPLEHGSYIVAPPPVPRSEVVMRSAIAFTVLVLTGCAGHSHPESARPATESVRVVGEGGVSILMTGSEGTASVSVAFSRDKVWAALPAIYGALGIPIGTVDPTRHL